jgi:hypothetical protein
MRYNCHINVEVYSSIKYAKYLYKYVFKGHDHVSILIDQARANMDGQPLVINEIKQCRDGRCIIAIEAIYILYGFSLYDMSPPVLQMQVHLLGKHMVAYKARDDLNNVVQHPNSQRSMLTEYFSTNMYNPDARKYLYREFPEHFTWIKSKKYLEAKRKRWSDWKTGVCSSC